MDHVADQGADDVGGQALGVAQIPSRHVDGDDVVTLVPGVEVEGIQLFRAIHGRNFQDVCGRNALTHPGRGENHSHHTLEGRGWPSKNPWPWEVSSGTAAGEMKRARRETSP
jgi:hypothetical protein